MYLQFFGLREAPFNNTLDSKFFFASPQHEEALASLRYSVSQRKGMVVVTGPIGSGKSLLGLALFRSLGVSAITARLNISRVDPLNLIDGVCREFEIPIDPQFTLKVKLDSIEDFLLKSHAGGRVPILLIDDAHLLMQDNLEQLRLIENLEVSQAKLLQIILLGQPSLQTLTQKPASLGLTQRIFRTIHLPPLTADLTGAYILHRLKLVGAPEVEIFSSDAVALIHQYTGGIPRLINHLCDSLMLSAFSDGSQTVDGDRTNRIIDELTTSGTVTGDNESSTSPAEDTLAENRLAVRIDLNALDTASAGADLRIVELQRLFGKIESQEFKLREHETLLDQRLRELNLRSHNLRLEEEQRFADFSSRLEQKSQEHEKYLQQILGGLESRLDDRQTGTDTRMHDLNRLTVGLTEQEQQIQRREKSLATQTDVLQNLTSQLGEREKSAIEKLAKLAQQVHESEQLLSQLGDTDRTLTHHAAQIEKNLATQHEELNHERTQFQQSLGVKHEEMKELIVQFESRENGWAKRLAALDERLRQFTDAQEHLRELESQVTTTSARVESSLATRHSELLATFKQRESELLALLEKTRSELAQQQSQGMLTQEDAARSLERLSSARDQALEQIHQSRRQLDEQLQTRQRELENTTRQMNVQNEQAQQALNQLVNRADTLLQQPQSLLADVQRQTEQVDWMVQMVKSADESLKKTLETSAQHTQTIIRENQTASQTLKGFCEQADRTRVELTEQNDRAATQTEYWKHQLDGAESRLHTLNTRLADQERAHLNVVENVERQNTELVTQCQQQHETLMAQHKDSLAQAEQTLTNSLEQFETRTRALLEHLNRELETKEHQAQGFLTVTRETFNELLQEHRQQCGALRTQWNTQVAELREATQRIFTDAAQTQVESLRAAQEQSDAHLERTRTQFAQTEQTLAGSLEQFETRTHALLEHLGRELETKEHQSKGFLTVTRKTFNELLGEHKQQCDALRTQWSTQVAELRETTQRIFTEATRTQAEAIQTAQEQSDAHLERTQTQLAQIEESQESILHKSVEERDALFTQIQNRLDEIEQAQGRLLDQGRTELDAMEKRIKTQLEETSQSLRDLDQQAVQDQQQRADQIQQTIAEFEQKQDALLQQGSETHDRWTTSLQNQSDSIRRLQQETIQLVADLTDQFRSHTSEILDAKEHKVSQMASQLSDRLTRLHEQMAQAESTHQQLQESGIRKLDDHFVQLRSNLDQHTTGHIAQIKTEFETTMEQQRALLLAVSKQVDARMERLRDELLSTETAMEDQRRQIITDTESHAARFKTRLADMIRFHETSLLQLVAESSNRLEQLEQQIDAAQKLSDKLLEQVDDMQESALHPVRVIDELRTLAHDSDTTTRQCQEQLNEMKEMIQQASKARMSIEAFVKAVNLVAAGKRGNDSTENTSSSPESAAAPSIPETQSTLTGKFKTLAKSIHRN